ncbi:hypothetical protein LF41_1148 [Lysobacter dokdonensis DS-58]|uniref:Uncharacterized protein n=1 Tax=Lysobacter dokdonensis DS-58 TaxID=1300345 RepID=A0A0A2WK93_9GAMM|nr:hypothetical protein LF41_1148 [Lysobacter dokdonensis DS-58]
MVLAMLVGACIGVSVVVMFHRDRFAWPASVPAAVVPMCAVIAIAALWKWRRLDIDIGLAVDSAIEALSRSSKFEASIRKSWVIGTVVSVLLMVAIVLVPTRDPNSAKQVVGGAVLFAIPCGMLVFGYLFKSGPTLVIDAHGLRHAAFGRIPWVSIVGLKYVETASGGYKVRRLLIAIASPHRFARQLPWLMRFVRPSLASAATPFGELQVWLDALDEPHEVIVAAAHEFRERAALIAMDADAPTSS